MIVKHTGISFNKKFRQVILYKNNLHNMCRYLCWMEQVAGLGMGAGGTDWL